MKYTKPNLGRKGVGSGPKAGHVWKLPDAKGCTFCAKCGESAPWDQGPLLDPLAPVPESQARPS